MSSVQAIRWRFGYRGLDAAQATIKMPSFRVVTVKEDLTGRYVAQLYRPADAPEPLSVTKQSFSSPQVAVSALLASLEPYFMDPLLVPNR